MTVIVYNDVVLTDVLTKNFQQEAVYDDSDTDLLHHKFTVRVSGIVHSVVNADDYLWSSPASQLDAAHSEQLIRRLLMRPRRFFVMSLSHTFDNIGENVLLRAMGPNAPEPDMPIIPAPHLINLDGTIPIDLNNGPKPRRCEVTLLAGTKVMRVEFEIEICILECSPTLPGNAAGVLSNRWNIQDDIDNEWYTTRTYNGRLRVAQAAMNAHMLRGWIMPPLFAGFRREHITCVTTKDGLNLDYTIVDKQVFACAPYPAVSWEAVDAGVTEFGNNLRRTVSVSVRGHKNSDREALLRICNSIIESRLRLGLQGTDGTRASTLEQATIESHLHENVVKMTATALCHPRLLYKTTDETGKVKWVRGFPWTDFTRKFDEAWYTPERATLLETEEGWLFGSGGSVGLLVAALSNPCNVTTGPVPTEPTTPVEIKSDIRKGDEKATNVNIGMSQKSASEAEADEKESAQMFNSEAGYTFYEVNTRYVTNTNTIPLPVAQPLTQFVPSVETGTPFDLLVTQAQEASTLNATTAFVRLGGTQVRRITSVKAVRMGQWPEVPRPTSYNKGGFQFQLVGDVDVTSGYPEVSPDKLTRRYELQIEWEHAVSHQIPAGVSLPVGVVPFDNASLADLAINSNAFKVELTF